MCLRRRVCLTDEVDYCSSETLQFIKTMVFPVARYYYKSMYIYRYICVYYVCVNYRMAGIFRWRNFRLH